MIRSFPYIKDLVKKAFMSVVDLLNVMAFSVLSFIALAVIFMQVVGTQYYAEMDIWVESNYTIVPATLPYETFATFFDAIINVFVIFISDNWDSVMLQNMMGVQLTNFQGTYPYYAYFSVGLTCFLTILLYSFCEYILKSIIVSAVINNFNMEEKTKREKQFQLYMKEIQKTTKSLSHASSRLARFQKMFTAQKDQPLKAKTIEPTYVARVSRHLYKAVMDVGDDVEAADKQTMGRTATTLDLRDRFNTFGTLLGFGARNSVSRASATAAANAAAEEHAVAAPRQTLFLHGAVQDFMGRGFEDFLQGREDKVQQEGEQSKNRKNKKKGYIENMFTPGDNTFNLAFGFLSENNWIRRTAAFITTYTPRQLSKITSKPLFDWLMILVILASTGFLAAESPTDHVENLPIVALYRKMDYVFISLFAMDAIIRITATGVILTPQAYFRDFWNIFDFVILVSMCIDTFYFQRTALQASQGIARFFRALRAVRPFRLVNQFDGLRDLLKVAHKGWKEVVMALVLTFLIFFPFSVWGVNLWAGKFAFCNDGSVVGKEDCIGEYWNQVDTEGVQLVLVPRVWGNPFYYNFDNIFWAFLTLFQISSEEIWFDPYSSARNYVGPDLNPGRWSNDAAFIFFIPFMLVGHLVINVSPNYLQGCWTSG